MFHRPRSFFGVPQQHQALLREVGLTELESIWTHPGISIWRSITERENGTLDTTLADGRQIRLHIKRYRPARGKSPAEVEVEGIFRLQRVGIPTVALVAWGWLADGRSFIVTEDLAGYEPADELIAAGAPFDRLLQPTADLSATLHSAGLHHRDLYLCHFFARQQGEGFELRLIDAGRVARLPPWPLRRRWIVKDLAQFWYSTVTLPVDENQRLAWLERYARAGQFDSARSLLPAIRRKAQWIARHDQELSQRQPRRNVRIPPRP